MFKIIKKLGGLEAAEAILKRRSVFFTVESQKKWFAPKRGRLPRDVALALAAAANKKGLKFSEKDFELEKQEGRR